MPASWSGARYMVAAALSFSLMSAFVKLAGRRLPIQEIVLFRALFTLLASLVLLRAANVSVWGTRRSLLVLRGVIGYAALSCVFYSVAHLPLAEAMTIQYLHPILTAVLAAVVLRERIAARLLWSTLVGLAGVLCVARPGTWLSYGRTDVPLFALVVAALGAVLTACAYVVVRSLAATEHPLTVVFYFPLVAVPAALPAVIADFVWPTAIEWVALALVGLFAQAGQTLLTHGLRLETAGRATALSYLQVVFASLLGLLLFDEVPTAWTLGGMALILLGSLAVANRGAAPMPESESAAKPDESRTQG